MTEYATPAVAPLPPPGHFLTISLEATGNHASLSSKRAFEMISGAHRLIVKRENCRIHNSIRRKDPNFYLVTL